MMCASLAAAQTSGSESDAASDSDAASGSESASADAEAEAEAASEPDAPPDELRRSRAYASPWSEGRARGFFAATFDVGFLYLRPRLSVGYGKPHNLWIGWDANPIVNISAAGGYTGLRLHHPLADLRVGARYGVAYNRSYFEPQRSYRGREFALDNGSTASYLSWEAELTLQIPAGRRGRLVSETAATYVSRVPSHRFVLEETIRVIVDPPWVWRTRLGYLFRFGAGNAIQLGVVAELVGVPKRDLVVVRGGFVLNWNVTPKIQVRGAWIPALYSRDQLGIRGGYFGTLGVRWRWATGMPDTPDQDLRCPDC